MTTLEETIARFPGKDNYGKPREDYIRNVFGMSDKELFEECEKIIWLSAYASNNPRSDYHWQCDVCYAAASARNRTDIYSKAHAEAVKSASGH